MKLLASRFTILWKLLLRCFFTPAIEPSRLHHNFSILLIVAFLFLSLPGRTLARHRVASGVNHSLAISSSGTLWAWGQNNYGQLGDGTIMNRYSPVQVGTGFTAVAGGGEGWANGHSLGLKANGTLWAWGKNDYGQLGDGTTTTKHLPVQVGTSFSAIAAGEAFSLGLKRDGTLWAWGLNHRGQLGDGTTSAKYSPVQVGTGFVSIAAGTQHSLGLKSDGTLWAWGYNGTGQLGDATHKDRFSPVQVGTGFASIAAGMGHSLGVKTDGTLWAWGDHGNGQLADPTRKPRTSPFQVGSGFSVVAAGTLFSLGLKTDGTLWGWGDNLHGQIGSNSQDSIVPYQIDTDVTAIDGGSAHSILLKADGTLWTLGSNCYGQVGDGTTTDRRVPTRVIGENGVGFLNLLDNNIVELALNETITGLSDTAHNKKYYKVSVPDAIRRLIIYTRKGSGNLTLTDYGTSPLFQSIVSIQGGTGTTKAIVIDNPQVGYHYFTVEGSTDYQDIIVGCKVFAEVPEFQSLRITKNFNISIDSLDQGTAYMYYFDIPENTKEAVITSQEGTGDLDLYVSKDSIPNKITSYASAHPATAEKVSLLSPEPGRYYLRADAASDVANAVINLDFNDTPRGVSPGILMNLLSSLSGGTSTAYASTGDLLGSAFQKFLSMIPDSVLENSDNTFLIELRCLKDVADVIEKLETLSSIADEKDVFKQFFSVGAVLSEYSGPAGKVFKTYFQTTAKLYDAIQSVSNNLKTEFSKTNNKIEFNIYAYSEKNWLGGVGNLLGFGKTLRVGDEIWYAIDSVKLLLGNADNVHDISKDSIARFEDHIQFTDRVDGYLNINKYLEITWTNGRKQLIPIAPAFVNMDSDGAYVWIDLLLEKEDNFYAKDNLKTVKLTN